MKDAEYFTKLIYNNYSWNFLYSNFEEASIKNTDNYSLNYILKFIKDIKIKKPFNKFKVLNIGSGREAVNFYKLGFNVTHIGQKKSVGKIINKLNKKKIKSYTDDFIKLKLKENSYDIVFCAGIIQHFEKPNLFLEKVIEILKTDGFCYLGFYRSGEFKYFIVDTIRYLIGNLKNEVKISNFFKINSIISTFGEKKHYQNSRFIDDAFVPYKYNFEPDKILKEIKKNNCNIYKYRGDFKKYNHSSFSYFSQKGDRVIFKKKKRADKLKVNYFQNINQLLDIKYKEKIINKNISLIKEIKKKLSKKKNSFLLPIICISLYEFTRPFNREKSFILHEAKSHGNPHTALSIYLNNLIKILK